MTDKSSAGAARHRALPWHNPDTAGAPVRLFCLPFAGGSAAVYRPWMQAFDGLVDVRPVELPGRGTRFRDRRASTMAELVEDVLPAVVALGDRPFALFGHSMGATTALALALALSATSGPPPLALFVSAAHAPRASTARRIARLDEPDFRQTLKRMNGIPPEVERHAELMDVMMPIVRADIAVVEDWTAPDDLLHVPVVAMGGTDDLLVKPPALERWAAVTSRPFRVETFPGDHFYLTSAADQLLDRLRAHIVRLAPLCASSAGTPSLAPRPRTVAQP